jgi:hypothetical protein
MRLKTTLIALLALVLIAPAANAQEASAVVSRLDTIIKEMEALKAEFATLVAATKPSGAVLGSNTSTKSVFTMSLAVGETNDDIKRIQKLLATDKEVYPYGVASGFFGPKTEEGIKNFQTRFGLDPVGVVGPATKALLELFFNAYPDENFPADVLKKKPQVLGASTSVPQTPVVVPTVPTVPTTPINTGDIEEITAKYDGEEAKVKVHYDDGETESLTIEGETKIKVVDLVAAQLGKTRSEILSVIEFTNADSDDEDEDEDEDEEDFNIDIEIDDEEVLLSFEFDGDEYEVEVDSTDEDDVLEEVADELDEDEVEDIDEDLADAIEEALEDALEDEDEDEDEGDDDIESITAQVANGEAEIEVEYGDGDDESFVVEETIESEIIEAVADELNIDEDEVEDIIEFEYEDIDEIRVEVEDGEALAFVEFEDGTVKRIRINSDDEDEIIEMLAEELDEDEEDIEDWLEIEFLD